MQDFKKEQPYPVSPEFPDPVSMDPMDIARHRWTKGRLEFMGGPKMFVQDGLDNNERTCLYPPLGMYSDPVAKALGVDETEQ